MPWLPETRPRALVGLIVFWCILFTLTHIPGGRLPKIPFVIRDLLLHFFAFLILTILYMSAFPPRNKSLPQYLFPMFSILVVYAGLDELLQIPVPGRDGSLHDFLADVCGVISAMIAVTGFRWVFLATRNSKDENLG